MNILITSANKKISLVQQFKLAATKFGGTHIYTADMNDSSLASLFSDKHFTLPGDNHKDYDNTLIGIIKNNNIQLLIPTRDEELIKFFNIKEKLYECGCTVFLPEKSTIEICLDKRKFVEYCIQNNFLVPSVLDTKKEVKYPVFARNINSKGSRNVIKVKSDEVLNQLGPDYLVQEYIDWQEYSIDLFRLEGNIIFTIPRKRLNIQNGESQITEIDINLDIIKFCNNLATSLKLNGHNVIQCFYKNGIVKFIEVNLRYGGASNLCFKAGGNSPLFVLEHLNSVPISYDSSNLQRTLKMFRVSQDVFKKQKINNKIYCIDIDGTICTENPHVHYESASPIQGVINKVNKLYDHGNRIILFTSRGYTSGYDWGPLTEKQLNFWGIKYHELHFGKPYADYYIDNKSTNVLDWVI